MLLEPDREKFLRRLNNFLDKQIQQSRSYYEPDYEHEILDDTPPEPIDHDDDAIIMDETAEPVVYMSKEELKAKLLADRKKKAK
jgi:hypothetical protein